MPFCTNCGNELNENAKFCDNCGTQTVTREEKALESKQTANERKVKKCPACGELIPTYTVICPSCGSEINADEISEGFSSFLNQVSTLERAIVNSYPNSNFFKLINIGKKLLWIGCNIFLFCIPLLIKLVINLININNTPKLSFEEQQLATFVENYSFPNNREIILEALVFAKEKIDLLSREKANQKNAYWVRLWYSKAEQLKDKANILFPHDSIVESSFQEIVKDKDKTKRSAMFQTIGGIVLLVALIIGFICIISSGSTQIKWRETGAFSHLPDPGDYYGEIVEETNQALVIKLTSIDQTQFDTFKQGCAEKGFVNNLIDSSNFYYGETEKGYTLMLFYDSSDLTLNINLQTIKSDEEGVD